MPSETVAVLSNKGGVGKTHIATNMALSLAERGLKVLLVDADWSSASVTRKLGLTPPKTWTEYFRGEAKINDLLMRTSFHPNLYLLPGTSGELAIANMRNEDKARMLVTLRDLARQARGDIIFYDLGAGVNTSTLDTALIADRILLVTTPQDILHGYSCLKALLYRYLELHEQRPTWFVPKKFRPMITVNMVLDAGQGQHVARTISNMLNRYARERAARLTMPIDDLEEPGIRGIFGESQAHLPLDTFCDVTYVGEVPYVRERFILAEMNKQPFLRVFPNDHAAMAIHKLAATVADHPLANAHPVMPTRSQSFWDRLSNIAPRYRQPIRN